MSCCRRPSRSSRIQNGFAIASPSMNATASPFAFRSPKVPPVPRVPPETYRWTKSYRFSYPRTMSRVASSLWESTTITSIGGSWTTRLSSRAARFLASLRTVVTTLTSNAARIGPAVMVVSTFIRAELSLLSTLVYFRVLPMGRIVTIIGTRPEIIKMAPVVKALDALDDEHILVHSGQHYDVMMDRIFLGEVELRDPDHRFELKEQPPHLQVATTMRQVATVAKEADLVIIHGDTNTTVAGALLARKLDRPLAHVEAGIRSFDKTMPEEVNRIIADQLSNLLFAPTATSRENLGRENVTEGVHVVGNSVIDALLQNLAIAEKRSDVLSRLGLTPGGYLLLTFHRSENVDSKERLARALAAFERAAHEAGLPILFPIHPRTARRLREFGLEARVAAQPTLRRIEPTGYLDMLVLEKNAALVMTDSGGLQEESCFFRVPCVTLRDNTERPETLEIGANVLAGTDPERVRDAVRRQLDADRKWPNPYGDGTTGLQIAERVAAYLG